MSHFTVMVVSDQDLRDEDTLGELLQPFHEFECTGVSDEYVQNINLTEDARANYLRDTKAMVKAPDGTLLQRYDDQFYREPTPEEKAQIGTGGSFGSMGNGLTYASKDWGDGQGRRPKIHHIPEGYEPVDTPRADVEPFHEFVQGYYGIENVIYEGDEAETDGSHKYGWVRLDKDGEVLEVIDRTNPNKKWDWWQVGGRWAGLLRLKKGANGVRGRDGIMGSSANKGRGHADIVQVKDIDLAGMRDQAGEKAGAKWDKVHKIVAGRPIPSWTKLREAHSGEIDKAREIYNNDPVVVDLGKAEGLIGWGTQIDEFDCPRDEYVQRARNGALVTFAMLKDGHWYERGRMGWWAMVSDEKDDWDAEFGKLFDSLDPETWVAVVDCHI